MGDLGKSMNTGIGSSRALNINCFAKKLARDAKQRSLDTSGVFLRLPAAVIGSVVF